MKNNQKYSKETLEAVVVKSKSIANVIRELGLKQSGGNHSHISRRIKAYGIDTSHFLGSRWNVGLTDPSKLEPCKILVYDRNNGRRESVYRLKRALLESEVIEECSICKLPPVWLNKPLVLQIDHIDGNPVNNLIENLRFLCGHCHSQTSTFGKKKSAINNNE